MLRVGSRMPSTIDGLAGDDAVACMFGSVDDDDDVCVGETTPVGFASGCWKAIAPAPVVGERDDGAFLAKIEWLICWWSAVDAAVCV